MKTGTKSVLFGAHAFWLHPWFVAAAWTRLYGFPWDPRLWLCFFLHDLGYWGKARMDDAEGERHVEWAAKVTGRLLGPEWGLFCLLHSRFYAKKHALPVSKLCYADKLSLVRTPAWVYLPMANLSGEVHEYMDLAKMRVAMGEPKYVSMKVTTSDQARWYADVQEYLLRWVAQHVDGREDTWTPAAS